MTCEVERGVTILKGDIKHTATGRCFNFGHTLKTYKHSLIFLGSEVLYYGVLQNWYDFLQKLKDKQDWLIVLKIALEIYQGHIKGFQGVPIEQDEREMSLRNKMRHLIEEGITTMIEGGETQEVNNQEF